MQSSSILSLQQLPPEIIFHIAQFNRPEVFNLADTCRYFQSILGLEKELYKRSLQPDEVFMISEKLFTPTDDRRVVKAMYEKAKYYSEKYLGKKSVYIPIEFFHLCYEIFHPEFEYKGTLSDQQQIKIKKKRDFPYIRVKYMIYVYDSRKRGDNIFMAIKTFDYEKYKDAIPDWRIYSNLLGYDYKRKINKTFTLDKEDSEYIFRFISEPEKEFKVKAKRIKSAIIRRLTYFSVKLILRQKIVERTYERIKGNFNEELKSLARKTHGELQEYDEIDEEDIDELNYIFDYDQHINEFEREIDVDYDDLDKTVGNVDNIFYILTTK